MKKLLVITMVSLVLVMLSGMLYAGDKAPQKVTSLVPQLEKLVKDPVIVSAVKAENAKGKTLTQIKELDAKWMATPGLTDYMKALMTSECGKKLVNIQKSEPYFEELFVMDNQGANVCMSNKTSDYWQGDEPKFIESYKGGIGGVHVSDVKFDESTQSYVVQISVPVKDGAKTIGAITFGINADKVK